MSGPDEPVLVGHDAATATFNAAWHAGRLHHAWLLAGPEGIGKATLARQLAGIVLAGGPDAAQRVLAGTHADLLLVGRTPDERRQRLRGEIVLDDVRPVGTFLRRTAAEAGWRVVIIDEAELMNRNAANALLKLIEEPPPKALLLLACSRPGRLPATMRSRCRTLRLAPLAPDQMRQVLRRTHPDLDEDARGALIAISAGSPGRVDTVLAEDGMAVQALVEEALRGPDGPAPMRRYEIADSVLRRENGFSTFIDLLSGAISQTMRRQLRQTAGPAGQASPRTLQGWARIGEELQRLRDETEGLNLDKRQALLAGLEMLST